MEHDLFQGAKKMSMPLHLSVAVPVHNEEAVLPEDRKSTRLNSSHVSISYAVFCLKKKRCPHWSIDRLLHGVGLRLCHLPSPPISANPPGLRPPLVARADRQRQLRGQPAGLVAPHR